MKKVITWVVTAALLLCTTVSAFAVDFTPSVTNPGAPSIESTGTETPSHGDNENIVGQVTDKDGNVLSTEYADCIWVASLKEALDANSDMSDNLRKLLKDLLKDFEDGKVDFSKIDGLSDVVGNNPVVRELFYAGSNCETLKEHLAKDGAYIKLKLKIDFEEDDVFTVIVKDGDRWIVTEAENNGDGTVTVKLESLGEIAFLVPGQEVVTPVEPESNGGMGWLAALAAAVAGAFGVGVSKKKKSKQA